MDGLEGVARRRTHARGAAAGRKLPISERAGEVHDLPGKAAGVPQRASGSGEAIPNACDRMLALPEMIEWIAGARAEPEELEELEVEF